MIKLNKKWLITLTIDIFLILMNWSNKYKYPFFREKYFWQMSEGAFRYHKYMIKSAPYGELQSVIDNLNKISPIDLESN